MSFFAMCAVALVAISEEQPRSTIADTASEGERDLTKIAPVFKKLIAGQPYGKTWLELAKTEPAPKDNTGLGQAKTHDQLHKDPMELHQQAQYVAPTDTVLRYGTVVIRGDRVFRYGKLAAMRLIFEPAGKAAREAFVADLAAIEAAWVDPAAALELASGFRVSKNDLVEQKKKKPDAYPVAPLVIELSPGTGTPRVDRGLEPGTPRVDRGLEPGTPRVDRGKTPAAPKTGSKTQ